MDSSDNHPALELQRSSTTGDDCGEKNDLDKMLLIETAQCMYDEQYLKELLELGADPNCTDLDGNTPLMLATLKNCTEIVKEMISTGCNLNIRNKRDQTALHLAAWTHRQRIVEILLRAGCAVNTRDHYGDTALMLCARRGYADIMQMLLDHGCDVTIPSYENATSLHYAARQGYVECVSLLVNHHLTPSSSTSPGVLVDLEQRTTSGFTPLMLTASGASEEAASILIGAGASITAVDNHGRSVLHHACRYNMTSLSQLLLDLGADPDAADYGGSVPLFEATTSNSDQVLYLLIKDGCQVKGVVGRATVNAEYRLFSPLEVAVHSGSLFAAQLLYDAGCEFRDFKSTIIVANIRNEAVREWLVSAVSQPRSLTDIIRIVVRNVLGRRLRRKIDQLRLPSALSTYLSFDNVLPPVADYHWRPEFILVGHLSSIA